MIEYRRNTGFPVLDLLQADVVTLTGTLLTGLPSGVVVMDYVDEKVEWLREKHYHRTHT